MTKNEYIKYLRKNFKQRKMRKYIRIFEENKYSYSENIYILYNFDYKTEWNKIKEGIIIITFIFKFNEKEINLFYNMKKPRSRVGYMGILNRLSYLFFYNSEIEVND